MILATPSAVVVADTAINYTEVGRVEAVITGAPAHEPPSTPAVAAAFGLHCIQSASCAFYDDVLLVIKLNPVRLLWADALLNFYATGFRHIVFFSSLRNGDTSTSKYLLLGPRRIKVHLYDDNYGFCDAHTVALAMERWPAFAGYIYLSDDVLFPFWQSVGKPKDRVWRQLPDRGDYTKLSAREKDAIREIQRSVPGAAGRLDVGRPPFALTSGMYFVPRAAEAAFRAASAILLRHRTYNEWGTPILLNVVDEGRAVMMRGKLVWGAKRLLVRRMMGRAFEWYHPVRASGELFTRMLHLVHTQQLDATSRIDAGHLFASPCLDCATYPLAQRKTKGLYHTCFVVAKGGEGLCGADSIESYAPRHWPVFRDARLVGGRVHVAPERTGIKNPLELRHEGFWNKEITLFVFEEYYPEMNRTTHRSKALGSYPECCTIDHQ